MSVCAVCHDHFHGDDLTECPSCGANPLLRDRYRLERELGEGAQGVTYLAADLETGRSVAVKEFSVRKARSLKAIELFEREVETLRALDHPAVPAHIDDFTVESGRQVFLYLVQNYVDGAPLALDARSDEAEVISVGIELCEIVSYLHSRRPPVIHRDIKPSNIMRRQDGSLVLIDFGAVKNAVDSVADGGSTVAGTFGYMAPEQLRGSAGPASDIYSIGATMVAMLAGRDAGDVLDIADPLAWREKVTCSQSLMLVLTRMLVPLAEQRLSETREVLELLRGVSPAVAAAPRVSATALEGDAIAIATSPQDRARICRDLDREWKRYRRAEQASRSDLSDILIPYAVVGAVGGFWGTYGTYGALSGLFGIKSLPAAMALVLGPLLFFFTRALLRRQQTRRFHPWRDASMPRAFREGWSASEAWSGELSSWLETLATDLTDREWGYRDAFRDVGEQSPRMLPVHEIIALGLAMSDKQAQAAERLSAALRWGKAAFSAQDVRYLDQLWRYAAIRAQSTGTREAAIRERADAERALQRLEATSGKSRAALLKEALSETEGTRFAMAGPAHLDSEIAREEIRRRAWLDWLRNTATDPRSVFELVFACFRAFFLGTGVFLVYIVLLAAAGAADDPSLAVWVGAMIVLLIVDLAVGTPLHIRYLPGAWRSTLAPDFDAIWPPGHPMRAVVIQAVERTWALRLKPSNETRDSLRQIEQALSESGRPDRVSDMIRRVREGSSFDDLFSMDRLMDGLDDASESDEKESADNDNPGDRTAQLGFIAELRALGGHSLEEVQERVLEMKKYPVLNVRRRAFALERAAIKAWRFEGGRTLATSWMAEVLALQRA